MLKERLRFERKKAILFTVDFSGPIEGYALAWLILTNRAREYSKMIWKISNTSKNDNVYVICNPKSAEYIKESLDGIYAYYDKENDKVHYIGKVINEEEVVVGIPTYEWDSDANINDPQWEKDCDNVVYDWIAVQEEC